MRAFPLALALLIAGCTTTPNLWVRADGGAPSSSQFETDKTVCEGRAAAAGIAGTASSDPNSFTGPALGLARTADKLTVMKGCMAERGWILQSR